MLLAVIVAGAASFTATPVPVPQRWLWGACTLPAVVLGVIAIAFARPDPANGVVTDSEAQALVERDIAYWLARRAGPDGATVLAPPDLTVSMCFHGGLRAIATPYRENEEGFAAAVRLLGASSPDEAQALAGTRTLTHIVAPTWDPFLDEYARLGTNQPDKSLIALLHAWKAPRWLRPVPYRLPAGAGFDREAVVVYEVVEVQDNATALGRLAEYFIEMGWMEPAIDVGSTLRDAHGTELSGLIGWAAVEAARSNAPAFKRAADALIPYVTEGLDGGLAWDRRLSLVVVLLQARRADLARSQVELCLAEADEARLRSLGAVPLRRLLAVCRSLGIEFPDPELHAFALAQLPPDMRDGL
jgi:hypothetical protein